MLPLYTERPPYTKRLLLANMSKSGKNVTLSANRMQFSIQFGATSLSRFYYCIDYFDAPPHPLCFAIHPPFFPFQGQVRGPVGISIQVPFTGIRPSLLLLQFAPVIF